MTRSPSHLLVTDRRALDLESVRRAAARRGWDVVLERLDGGPVPPDEDGWFPEILRLVVTAHSDGPGPDARVLLASSPGLALDEPRSLPRPPRAE